MKKLNLVILGVLALSAFSLDVGAFTQGACKPDIEKFCPGMGFDKTKIEKCIFDHRTEVSDACKANIQEMEKQKDAKDAKPGS